MGRQWSPSGPTNAGRTRVARNRRPDPGLLLRHRRPGARQGVPRARTREAPALRGRLDPDQHHDQLHGRHPATPFGPRGDLFLVPAPKARWCSISATATPVERWFLGDILNSTSTPWDCCPRSLPQARPRRPRGRGRPALVASLRARVPPRRRPAPQRRFLCPELDALVAPFTRDFLAALRLNGLPPDTFLPEYGPRQYEITVDPAPAWRPPTGR
jgi:glutamine synthetase